MNKFRKIIYLIIALLFLIGASSAKANFEEFVDDLINETDNVNLDNNGQTVIKNNVSAKTSTGGKTAENGEVKQGEAKSTVILKTQINGEVVEDEKIGEESSNGSAEISIESNIHTKNNDAIVTSTIIINDQEETSVANIDFKNTEIIEDKITNVNEQESNKDKTDDKNIIVKIINSIYNSFKNGIFKVFNFFT